jgi:hypothetical protein
VNINALTNINIHLLYLITSGQITLNNPTRKCSINNESNLAIGHKTQSGSVAQSVRAGAS